MKLAVELGGYLVGVLEGNTRTFDFTPTTEAIEIFGVNSTALSVSIPFVKPQKQGKASLRRN